MRSIWVYVSFSIIFLSISSVAERYPVLPREDQSPSSSNGASPSDTVSAKASDTNQPDTPPSTASSPRSSQASSPGASASDRNAETGKSASPSRTAAKSTSASQTASSSDPTVISATSTANSTLTAPNNGTTSSSPDGLPIHPTITPALSVTGAYLILSGGIYLLIGIKTKWLHIFLSAAYLTSLAVTVLIIYVMHPPISNAIQGAYFIAAFLTGVVFGGGSVVFADVTEGLGCLLGGFCLSMWFLVLKPGGLLTSTAGKAIFIACFTLGAFAFYISHYTRPYGLIGATSFAGASVVVLGIDCFSRAGLKEFWLYIWNLNDAIFPPHYDKPYPITRGIRVEIACTVLLFLLGIMSQMKVWKIIKERREQKAAAELEEAQRRERTEEDLGRKLEEGNGRERAIWDAVYGDQENSKRQQIDSGIGTDTSESLRKGSLSAVGAREMRNSGSGSIEMSNLDAPGGSSQRPSHDENQTQDKSRVTIHVASDDEIQQTPLVNFEHLMSETRFSEISTGTSILDPAASMTKIVPPGDLVSTVLNKSKDSSSKFQKSGPKVVPLPFTVPASDAGHDNNDDASSIATFAASEHFPQGSKRMSSSSLLRSFSRRSQHHLRNASVSEEALIVPHIEDDQASSVAATIDGVSTDRDSDDEAASVEKLTKSDNQGQKDLKELDSMDNAIESGYERRSNDQMMDMANQADEQHISHTNKTQLDCKKNDFEPFKEDSFAGVKEPGKLANSLVFPGKAEEVIQNEKSAANHEISRTDNSPMKLSGNLPGSTSKVVMAYRTNEWAKHLGGAETPELDELGTVNALNPTKAETGEAAVPVRITDLQQTPLTAEPAPMPINRSPQPVVDRPNSSASKESLHQSSQGSLRRHASGGIVERSSSQTSLQSIQNRKESQSSTLTRLPSSQTSLVTNRGFRSSSTPLVSATFVESPIEEGVESSFPARFTPSPMHLISHRENMVRNRVSSTSLNRTTSSSSLSPAASPPNESPMPQALPTLNEDITLSTRKSILQQQNPSHSSLALQQQQHPSRSSLTLQQQQNPSRSSLALQPSNPSSSSTSLQQQHQQNPTRSVSNPRESTLSAWRSSLRADLPAHQAAQHEIDVRRSEMIHEKRRASTSQQWAQLESGRRESGMDKGMRRGDLLDKHREAMRRMQSEAMRKL